MVSGFESRVALEKAIFSGVWSFDFDFEQIRFSGGHPFVCRSRSYLQQAENKQQRKGSPMQTLYVGIAFSMMVILPLLVAKWSGSPRDEFDSFAGKDQ